MVLSLAACSSQKGGDVNGGFPASAVDLLTAVWNAYPESEKFSVVGGSLDNPVDNAPGAFPVDDADNLDYMLHFPADKSDLIDDAASLTHMMNANSFTCGAFHVKNSGDVSAVADALRQNVQNTQWMCGFPDKLVVLTYGEYVVALFGADDLVDDFVNTTDRHLHRRSDRLRRAPPVIRRSHAVFQSAVSLSFSSPAPWDCIS